MNRKPIDRPFRSREELEMERALRDQYRRIGIADVVEALPATQTIDPSPASAD